MADFFHNISYAMAKVSWPNSASHGQCRLHATDGKRRLRARSRFLKAQTTCDRD